MERHSLRALVLVGVLIVLAWVGIALFAKHGGGGRVVLLVIWAVAEAGVLASLLWNVWQARQARLERRPEATRGR